VAASSATPDISSTQPLEMLPEAALLQPVAIVAPSPAIAAAAPAAVRPAEIKPAETKPVETKSVEAELEKVEKADVDQTQPLEIPPEAAIMTAVSAVTPPAQTTVAAAPATSDIAATQPLQLQAEEPAATTEPLQPQAATPAATAQPLPVVPVIEPPAASGVVAATVASEPSPDFIELSLMATGAWAAMPRVTPEAKPAVNASENDTGDMPVLNGPETLSLIAGETASSTPEPTLKLAVLADPAAKPKRAANGD
jgi:hypothetical protein